jgi:molecular chaperone GrpE
MGQDDDYGDGVTNPADSDEIEILEVVGVQEGGAASSGHAAPGGTSCGTPEPHEVVLAFESTSGGGPEAPAATTPAPAPPRPPRGRSEIDEETLLRLRADYDNLRKRVDRERQEFETRANLDLIGRLLPILDGFERALAYDARPDGDRAFRDGVDLIYRQLADELRRHGLRRIEVVGQPFDPQLHDAVATDATSDHPANTVVEELRRGYLFGDLLLRPAMVRVATSRFTEDGEASEEGSGG